MKANKPSATALLIARSTLFTFGAARVGHLVPKESAVWSRRFVLPQNGRATALISNKKIIKLFRPLVAAIEHRTLPGIQLHYALRKRRLEEVTREALSAGVRQIVIIGAGFDSLALRLHRKFSTAMFVELDHAGTQKVKTRIVGSYGQSARNLRFVACDLTQWSFAENLLRCADYRPSETTLFIAEGVLMYLALDEVEQLLQCIKEHSGASSRIAFTFMESIEGSRIAFHHSSRLVDAWLRWRGEIFKWRMQLTEMDGFLAARGFQVREMTDSEALRHMYLDAPNLYCLPLADGECLCVAYC